jgi:hypothetical protein
MHRQSSPNKRHALSAALVLLLPLLAGCGSNGGARNPVAPISPGPTTQTGTLVVVGGVAANADSAGNFDTQFTVSLADTGTGAAVSGATVEFSTPSGLVSLVEDSGTPGTYRAQTSGHTPGAYALSVVRGADVAAGSINMPEAHTINSPAPNDTINSNGSLNVTWTRVAAAQEAWIDTQDWTTGSQTDSGSGKVPRGHNQPRNNQWVGVSRRNSANPAGMAAGSVLRASVRVSVEPVVVQ